METKELWRVASSAARKAKTAALRVNEALEAYQQSPTSQRAAECFRARDAYDQAEALAAREAYAAEAQQAQPDEDWARWRDAQFAARAAIAAWPDQAEKRAREAEQAAASLTGHEVPRLLQLNFTRAVRACRDAAVLAARRENWLTPVEVPTQVEPDIHDAFARIRAKLAECAAELKQLETALLSEASDQPKRDGD